MLNWRSVFKINLKLHERIGYIGRTVITAEDERKTASRVNVEHINDLKNISPGTKRLGLLATLLKLALVCGESAEIFPFFSQIVGDEKQRT